MEKDTASTRECVELDDLEQELASYGQRLRGRAIIQTHDGPLMLPCKPRVVGYVPE